MNRLGTEPSPYLRQHADNPVDWYPWGPEALDRAKREDRPILLSVGYSACHWCHVMAHESFEDPRVAAVMNQHFINIKIDREERPDLDQLYQGVVQLLGRGGGWPLTVFLTPDLRPFYGGTYFPPAPRHGLPAFEALLEGIAQAWKETRHELEHQADEFKKGLSELTRYGLESSSGQVTPADVVTAARALSRKVDRRHGGFGQSGPKFPNPMNLALLLRGYRRSGDTQLKDDALFSLEKMALGGVYDQLGGGFHRYSVDERWLVPHFEKMLYDNAQLLHLAAEAWWVAPRPLWRKVATETVGWLTREMTSPEGGFYAAQDADSEGEEGRFFVWRHDEVTEVLGADAALVAMHFHLEPSGNFEHGTTILEVQRDEAALAKEFGLSVDEVSRRLDAAKKRLFEVRAKRVAPGRDDKVLAGWNGLMIRGLALAARAFGEPGWAALARRAADFLLEKLRQPNGRLMRSWHEGHASVDGMLEDYGDVASGLVALYQATFEPRYLEVAQQLADLAFDLFWDPSERAWLAAPKGQSDLLVPTFALHDNAFPSGASTLAEAQVTLAALTGAARHLERAAAYIERLREELLANPFGYGHLWLAADALADGGADVCLVGTREGLTPLQAVVDSTWAPTTAVLRHEVDTPVPEILREVLASRTTKSPASAWVCRNFACSPPVSSADALKTLLTA